VVDDSHPHTSNGHNRERTRDFVVHHDPVLEMIVVAALFSGDEAAVAKVLSTVRADSFQEPKLRAAFEGARRLAELGRAIAVDSLPTVARLDRDGVEFLRGLVRDRPTAPPDIHALLDQLLYDGVRMRVSTHEVNDLLEAMRDPMRDRGETLALARKIVEALDSVAAGGGVFERAITGYEASRAVLAEPTVFLWDEVIASDSVVELAGKSATGKSTLAFMLAVAGANPTSEPVSLFGRKVNPIARGKRVLTVNEENGRKSAVKAIDKAIEIFGLPPEETWERIWLFARAGIKGRGRSWDELVAAARRGEIGMSVFDTRARIFRCFGPSKDEETQAAVAEAVQDFVSASGGAALVVSHATKAGEGNDIEDIAGSAQRGAAADVILMVSADRKQGRVLSSTLTFAKLRDGDEVPSPVTYSTARGEGGKWVLAHGEAAPKDDGVAPTERVHELLVAKGEKTKTEIATELHMSDKSVQLAIDVLKGGERLHIRKGVTPNGRKTWFFGAVEAGAIDDYFKAHPRPKKGSRRGEK
jgi:hypothetical protein